MNSQSIDLINPKQNIGMENWSIVNDDVMGGISKSNLSMNGENNLIFSGYLSLENNGGFASSRLSFPKETLRFIAFTYCPEKGVRKLEKCIETIIMKLNLYSITNDLKSLNVKDTECLKNPYNITIRLASSLLDPIFKREEISISCQLMYT